MSNTTASRTRRTAKATAQPATLEPEISTAADSAPKGWMQTKAPSELHVDLAAYIEEQTGLVVSPKAVQAVLGLHPEYQRSERNKTRQAYRPRIAAPAPVSAPQPKPAAKKSSTRKQVEADLRGDAMAAASRPRTPRKARTTK